MAIYNQLNYPWVNQALGSDALDAVLTEDKNKFIQETNPYPRMTQWNTDLTKKSRLIN
jgi:hypothetical protein